MAIPDEDVARVRAATDIVALIGEHAALRQQGRRWVGLCPFHAEKSPSFSVNAQEGLYYCFGCQVSGDAISFVKATEHLDFADAVRFLADRAGVTIHEDASGGADRRRRTELLDAMERAVTWYHERLLSGPDAGPARNYLRSRGYDAEVVRKFRLGWAPDEWDALAKGLELSERVLTDTGLGFVNRRGRRQDSFRSRIVFPICDPSGRPVAFGGRILPTPPGAPPLDRPEPKYKNSQETPIYSKRRTLYALNWAKHEVVASGEVIVCEGYTDVIAFFGAGMPRAVATCGTALGEEHFRTMRNFATRIVLAYDADKAGQSAAASVYQWERQHEVDVFVARLPKGSDPAELAQNDPEALRQSISTAVPFLQFRLDRVLEAANLATAEGRVRAAEAAMQVLAEHPSELVRDQYLMQVADQLRLEPASLRPRVADFARSPVRREIPNEPHGDEAPSRRPLATGPMPRPGLEALRLYLNFPREARDRFIAQYFVNDIQREIFEGLATLAPVSEVIDALERRGEEEAASVLSQLVVDELDRDYTSDDVTAVVSQLLRSAVGEELRNVERELRMGTLSPDIAMATIRDVKERVALLETPHGELAEKDLRSWLLTRSAATP